jgi:hypothetical protein
VPEAASFCNDAGGVSRKLRGRLQAYEAIAGAAFLVYRPQQIGGRTDILDCKRVVDGTRFDINVTVQHLSQTFIVVCAAVDRLLKDTRVARDSGYAVLPDETFEAIAGYQITANVIEPD